MAATTMRVGVRAWRIRVPAPQPPEIPDIDPVPDPSPPKPVPVDPPATVQGGPR